MRCWLRGWGRIRCCGWRFEKDAGAADSRRAFGDMGIAPRGLMMGVERKMFQGLVKVLEGLFRA